MTKLIRISLFTLLVCGGAAQGHAGKFFALGTASSKGTYFPVGRAFCQQINKYSDAHRLRCLEYVTGGSVYNIHALMTEELDLAITRSDLSYYAFKGRGRFKGLENHKQLRTVLNLYTQPLLVTVKTGNGISNFSDFKGRSINIGNKGSGKRDIAQKIFSIMNWNNRIFSAVTEYSTSQQGTPFCQEDVDILIESIGLPNKFYTGLIKTCGAMFIAVSPKVISGLKKLGPFFFETEIPKALNPANKGVAKTVGIKVVLITTIRQPIGPIKTLANVIINNLDEFRNSHPSLKGLSKRSLFSEGINIPLHPGVTAALSEVKGKLR